MHFDDRLATVLRLPSGGGTFARTRFRQLIDVLGRLPADAVSDTIEEAYGQLAGLCDQIPAQERAAILAEPTIRLDPPRLAALLGAEASRLAPTPPAAATEGAVTDGVGALLRRIEQFRRAREQAGSPSAASTPTPPPRQPAASTSLAATVPTQTSDAEAGAQVPRGMADPMIDFSTDVRGRIDRASGVHAPALVGVCLASCDAYGPAGQPPLLASALQERQPVRGLRIELAGGEALAGEWQLDASPRFDPLTARYLGHIGRLRRPLPLAPPLATTVEGTPESDRLRQVLHELRTPANAVQLAAEIIQQQIHGPTPHAYRALSASIAADIAQVLAGLEELDRLARLEGGTAALAPGTTSLGPILARVAGRLGHWSAREELPRIFRLPSALPPLHVALDPLEAERLIWRLLGALSASASRDERLDISASEDGAAAIVTVALPARLREDAADGLPVTDEDGVGPGGSFGPRFALRLATAEARAAGGVLTIAGGRAVFRLPLCPAA